MVFELRRDQRVENALKPFAHYGRFRFGALPRCPACYEPLSELLKDDIHFVEIGDVINADTEEQRLSKLAAAVRTVADLPAPTALDIENLAPAASSDVSQMLKTWVLRPAAHKGQELTGVFRVGEVRVVDHSRAVWRRPGRRQSSRP